MYEYLGRRYHLDSAIFMPFKFHEGRDNTFIYSSVGALHARYVIDGDGFRLVTIDEKTRREALQNYYSLLPPAKYWKYDAQAPTLFSTFAAWHQAPGFNPFYYAIWGRYRSELLQLCALTYHFIVRLQFERGGSENSMPYLHYGSSKTLFEISVRPI